MGICEGRVVIVTGAGRGIGREHALELARQGARVVVNDLGATAGGEGADGSPAQEVAAEVRRLGGEAIVDGSVLRRRTRAGRPRTAAIGYW
jgi:NAD(P)-dependent dehydrogenase (short-subunit alcohol dehydrogenase family)